MVRGEVARLWARWIEAGQREGGEERPEGERRRSARLGSCELEEREGLRWTGSFQAACARRRVASGAIADAWRLAAGHSHRYGVGGVTVKALESTVIRFKDFDSILAI